MRDLEQVIQGHSLQELDLTVHAPLWEHWFPKEMLYPPTRQADRSTSPSDNELVSTCDAC